MRCEEKACPFPLKGICVSLCHVQKCNFVGEYKSFIFGLAPTRYDSVGCDEGRFIFPEYPNENDDENRDLGLIFNFDFVETAMLVTCINKFPHTRLLAVFNFQLALPCQAKNKNRLLSILS